jgi:Fe2+ transport system protein FeoA
MGPQIGLFWRPVNKRTPACVIVDGQCAGPHVCPLSRVQPGQVVCIKQLAASPDVRTRLREMGFCEKQRIKLLSRHSNIICQVCNARLGISRRLAESILVEPLPVQRQAA